MLALMTIMAVLSGADAPATPVVGYDDAVRCAGLTQAASELAGMDTPDDRLKYQRALYWSVTTATLARARGRDAHGIEADQTQARIRAVAELTRRESAAASQLRRCETLTPGV